MLGLKTINLELNLLKNGVIIFPLQSIFNIKCTTFTFPENVMAFLLVFSVKDLIKIFLRSRKG